MKNTGVKPALIIGNWKMNKTIAETRGFIATLALSLPAASTQVGLAIPFTMLSAAAAAARGTGILIGSQDVSDKFSGAYTGDISPQMVVDTGAVFTLIGHSERRKYHQETDEIVNVKLQAALTTRLFVVVCIGESEEEKKQGLTEKVLEKQIRAAFSGLQPEHFNRIILAYEPLWAIGTGKNASAEEAQQVHRFCRSVVESQWGKDAADTLIIQYGGSVRVENAEELLAQPDINGLLVGGASLDVENFSKIIHCRIMRSSV